MPLAAGQSLSFYEILAPLGVGAMGEVYRAKDTRLDREVAIKVLPEHFAEDEERLRRFEREAKSLASLNHSNVAQVFGIDQVGDTCFIAMELVPGETLEARIARGAVPPEEAVDVCCQIAEGLEAAHAAGVIHRDLKPANVRITPGGMVKVLDFGLAKPSGPPGENGETGSTTDSVLATEEGRLLGTPTYMAPEQARGKPIDRRVDVWAFGCVLYECLTAERAFRGETLSDVLAAVLQDEPDLTLLPPGTPAHVRELIARCLQKDPRQRLRDMGDAWLELTRERDGEAPRAAASLAGSRGRRILIAGVVVALAAGGLLGFLLRGGPASGRPRLSHLALPQSADRVWDPSAYSPTFAISSDGEKIVYCSEVRRANFGRADVLVLWERSAPESRILWEAGPGLDVGSPFFSSDGAWICFRVQSRDFLQLRRIPVLGGNPEVLCSLPRWILGATWEPDGALLFGTLAGGIYRVAPGGAPEPVTTPEPGVEWLHKCPSLLPGGREMLFVIDYEGPKYDVVLRSLTTGHQEVLVQGASWARYVEPGILVYTLGEDLWADGFDPGTHRLDGSPVQLPERVATGIPSLIDVGRDGTLVYATPALDAVRSLVWVDRGGHEAPTAFPTSDYAHALISPSGERAVFGFDSGGRGGEVRVGDLDRGTLESPLVWERAAQPMWSADGEEIVWFDGSNGHLARQSLTGGGLPEQGGLFEASPLDLVEGDRVLYCKPGEGGYELDLFLTPFGHDTETDRTPLVVERGSQVNGDLSRDGEWLAYVSLLQGDPQVFVSRVPVEGPGKQVSFRGGAYPRWNRDADELYFSTPTGNLMMVSVTSTGSDFELGEPVFVYDNVSTTTGWPNQPFDATPDGQRFLVIKDDPSNPAERPELRVVDHWIEEVRARLKDRE